MTDPSVLDPAILASLKPDLEAADQAALQGPTSAVLGGSDAGNAGIPVISPAPPGDRANVLSQSALGAREQELAKELTDPERKVVQDQLSMSPRIVDPSDPAQVSADVKGMVIDVLILVAEKRPGVAPLRLRSLTVDVLMEPEPDATLTESGSRDDLAALWLGVEVWEVANELVGTVTQEWADLPGSANESFVNEAREVKADPFAYYQRIRSYMYIAGWIDPFSRFWKKIEPTTLCGAEITYGVHEMFLQRLSGPGVDLTQPNPIWPPGSRVVLGFQPRKIKNRPDLSNHAFGLAIDINPEQNAIIVGKDEIRIVQAHTSEHLDLGKALNLPALPSLIATVQKAAHDFIDWLNAAVPREQELRNTLDNARAALTKLFYDPLATNEQIAEAEQQVNDAQTAYDTDPLVPADVAALRSIIGDKGIETWELNGFLNLPVALIDSLTGRGFIWGGAYNKLKDFMHFEIDARTIFGNQ